MIRKVSSVKLIYPKLEVVNLARPLPVGPVQCPQHLRPPLLPFNVLEELLATSSCTVACFVATKIRLRFVFEKMEQHT